MNRLKHRVFLSVAAGLLSALLIGYAMPAASQALIIHLVGAEEVPPVDTAATGLGNIDIGDDGSVSGNVRTTGMDAVAAHIHDGAAGTEGPVIITLIRTGPDTWSVPQGAKLSDAQYKDYKDGKLYLNVHSKKHKGGEVRGQMKP